MVALFDVGGGELVLIGVVALLLFGGDLPKVMRQVGRVVADLRRQAESLTNEFRDDAPRNHYTPPRVPRAPKPPPSLPVDTPIDEAAPHRDDSTMTSLAPPSDAATETRPTDATSTEAPIVDSATESPRVTPVAPRAEDADPATPSN